MAEDIGKYSLRDAEKLIKLARRSIEFRFTGKKPDIPDEAQFKQARGVFITLNTYPGKQLRGCIGFPEPVLPVWQAVMQAAQSAAFSDPRFPSLTKNELDKIIIEISILTVPQECKTDDIEIGKDGLICNYLGYSGLLLPQVATEHKMNRIEFLECVCEKANLPKDAWQKKEFNLKKFQAQIFKEEKPNGKVVEGSWCGTAHDK